MCPDGRAPPSLHLQNEKFCAILARKVCAGASARGVTTASCARPLAPRKSYAKLAFCIISARARMGWGGACSVGSPTPLQDSFLF